MYIRRVKFENFRNFESLELECDQGFVVLTGPNGAGKTNFLEGLYFLGGLRRFPESHPSQLFRDGSNYLRLSQVIKKTDDTTMEVFGENPRGKTNFQFKINILKTSRSAYVGNAPVISFLPQDLGLLTRSPQNRRRFLDETLSLVSAQYRHALARYKRILAQRNEFLKQISASSSVSAPSIDLEVWDEKLAEHGAFLCLGRKTFVDYLNANFASILLGLGWQWGKVSAVYHCCGALAKIQFLEKLRGVQAEEKERATTLVGPHRDDFSIQIDSQPAVGRISRGQMRTIVLALKFFERNYYYKKTNVFPLILLDDIFSEFDQPHQKQLAEFLEGFPQVFFTTTHPEEVGPFLPSTAQIFLLENGKVKTSE